LRDPLHLAKGRLRASLAAARRAVPAERAAAAAEAVRSLLVAWEPFRAAPRVALYAALPDELPTRPCFEAVRSSGRPALLPRIGADGGLVFHAVARWDALEVGRYGVPTPPADAEPLALASADLVLVPGVAFDARGMRLGRGGGYYDRTFADREGGPLLCGAAYAFQRVAEVPHGSHDRPMDAIVTEQGLHEVTERA